MPLPMTRARPASLVSLTIVLPGHPVKSPVRAGRRSPDGVWIVATRSKRLRLRIVVSNPAGSVP